MFGNTERKLSSDPAQFPQQLSRVIEDGQKHGLSEEMMVQGMVSVGNLMGQFVNPDSPEEALMKESKTHIDGETDHVFGLDEFI